MVPPEELVSFKCWMTFLLKRKWFSGVWRVVNSKKPSRSMKTESVLDEERGNSWLSSQQVSVGK